MKTENVFRFISLYKPTKKAKPQHVISNPNPTSPCQDKLNSYLADGRTPEQARSEMEKNCIKFRRIPAFGILSQIQDEVSALLNDPSIASDPISYKAKFSEIWKNAFGQDFDQTSAEITRIMDALWEAHCCFIMFPEQGVNPTIDLEFWIKVFELLKNTTSTNENAKSKDLLMNFRKYRIAASAELAIPKERYMNISSPNTGAGDELNDEHKQRKDKIETIKHTIKKLQELKQKMEDLYEDKIEENEKKAEKEREENESKLKEILKTEPLKNLASPHKTMSKIESLKTDEEDENEFFFSYESDESDIAIKFNRAEFTEDELLLLRNQNIKFRNRYMPDVTHDLTLRIAELNKDVFEIKTVTEIVRVNGVFVRRKKTLDI